MEMGKLFKLYNLFSSILTLQTKQGLRFIFIQL